jgi:hypothetical protein
VGPNPAVPFFFIGLGAIAGSIGVMKDLMPFPEVWLQGTPFHSYFFPGLILCLVVGGSQLLAAFYCTLARLGGQDGFSHCRARADGMDGEGTRADWFSSADPDVLCRDRLARSRLVLHNCAVPRGGAVRNAARFSQV